MGKSSPEVAEKEFFHPLLLNIIFKWQHNGLKLKCGGKAGIPPPPPLHVNFTFNPGCSLLKCALNGCYQRENMQRAGLEEVDFS